MVAGYRSDVAGVADHLASVAGVYPAMIHGGVALTRPDAWRGTPPAI
jgi:hypothetical protein